MLPQTLNPAPIEPTMPDPSLVTLTHVVYGLHATSLVIGAFGARRARVEMLRASTDAVERRGAEERSRLANMFPETRADPCGIRNQACILLAARLGRFVPAF